MTVTGIAGRLGEVHLQTGTSHAFTTRPCTVVTGTTYDINDAGYRQWDPRTAPTVYDGGVEVDAAAYTVQYPIGRIVFDEAPGGAVTVTGKYYVTAKIAFVQDWTLSLDPEMRETTSLGDTSRSFVGLGLLAWSASFEKISEATEAFGEAALANATAGQGYRLVWKFYEGVTADRVWIGYATFASWQAVSNVMELIKESLSVTGDGDIFYLSDET